MNKQQDQVDKNYKYFREHLGEIKERHYNKSFILLKDGKDVAGFNTMEDALEAARVLYQENENYSIQEINEREVNLGFQTYATL